MNLLDLVVRRRQPEAQGICSFELEAPDGGHLPAFTAGAHVDVHLGEGLVRQYSLCNDQRERSRYRIAVLRDPASRGGSLLMHDWAVEGRPLRVGLPRNLFALEANNPALLVAGGIGITPLLSMAYALSAKATPWRMHCCARSVSRQAFREEILAGNMAGSVRFHTDDGSGGEPFDARTVLAAAAGDTHLYVCGPVGFMDHVLATARELGWSQERLHREYFAAPRTEAAADGSFILRLARSGRELVVPAERTALQVLIESGIDVPYACESGVCGTCLTPVLEGTLDHRDAFLSDEERAANNQFTPCCSRACSGTLVIDL